MRSALIYLSSVDIEVNKTVFFVFFNERYFKCKNHKQNPLSNIQPNIVKQKKTQTKASKLTFIYIFLSKQKHLSNIQPDIFKQKKNTNKSI